MAIVKVLFRKNAGNVIRYVFEHTQPGDHVDSESCPPYAEGACEEFEAIRNLHHYKEGNNQAIHIVQSWNAQESQKLSPKQVNEMGTKLVADYFKGHQFVVVTHTETGKFHNHIVVNTMNLETGKHVETKFKHLHNLRALNDKICLERGLKIPNQDPNQRRTSVPHKVQQMVHAGRESWVWDIKNKADVARYLATSHDQYVEYLDALGVKARTENQNITYFYPGRSRGKRGSKLGKNYDKPGLEEQFKQNNERFKTKPGGISIEELKKNYSSFTKVPRGEFRTAQLAKSELTRGIIPIEEIRKAKKSILDYCHENKIPLSTNILGHTVLRDKGYIVIQGDKATNTRNGTHATLIDFVASHHHLTLLQAVAKINKNPDLLAFEQHFGEIKRKYTSFYIPKPDQMPQTQAVVHLSRFLEAHHISPKVADPLLKHQRVEVSKSGVIRLFAETDSEGTLEYTPGSDRQWSEKKQGVFLKPFFKRPPRGNQMILFMDPKSYMAGRGHDLFSDRKTPEGLLVLMEPNPQLVEHYLKENPGVKQITFITPKGRHVSPSELDFFGVMKKKLEPFLIEVGSSTRDRSLGRETQGLSL